MKAEAELQHLYTQLTGILDLEGANTMIDIVSPFARNELATKADLSMLRTDFADFRGEMRSEFADFRGEMRSDFADLRGEMRSDLAEFKHDLVRTLAGWIFLSQAVLVAIVGLIVSLG